MNQQVISTIRYDGQFAVIDWVDNRLRLNTAKIIHTLLSEYSSIKHGRGGALIRAVEALILNCGRWDRRLFERCAYLREGAISRIYGSQNWPVQSNSLTDQTVTLCYFEYDISYNICTGKLTLQNFSLSFSYYLLTLNLKCLVNGRYSSTSIKRPPTGLWKVAA